MFKINGTTGVVESTITMTSESYTINDGTVTFFATFDHFSVFAIVAQPPLAASSGDGGDGVPRGPRSGARRLPEEVTITEEEKGVEFAPPAATPTPPTLPAAPSPSPAPSTPVPEIGWFFMIIVAIVASVIIVSVAYVVLRRRRA